MLKIGVPRLFIKMARQRSDDSGPYCPARARSTMLSGRTAARLSRCRAASRSTPHGHTVPKYQRKTTEMSTTIPLRL